MPRAQSRVDAGREFEELVCETNGWRRKEVSPKINWIGEGRSNWVKIERVGFNPRRFVPNIEKSIFDKYDAINGRDQKIEIKKYDSSELRSWTMYSEPIFKVATRSQLETVIEKFGDGDYNRSVERYNNFVSGMIPNVGDEILNAITQSNIGIQCVDRFIPQSELEYRWNVRSGWEGYNRLSIEFRLR